MIAFILKGSRSKKAFLYKTKTKLENMGMDESELIILATDIDNLFSGERHIWSNVFNPSRSTHLL